MGLMDIFGRKTNAEVSGEADQLEMYLVKEGCLLMVFEAPLNNPSVYTLRASIDDFKANVKLYMKGYNPVYIFKQRQGDKIKFYILNEKFVMYTEAKR
jgi:hypothetical protein